MDFVTFLAEWPMLWVASLFFILLYIWVIAYHVAVIFRGWPPELVEEPQKEDDKCEEGEFMVRQGHHEVLIHTCHEPSCVWIALADDGKYPVCHSETDKATAIIRPDGFIAVVDICSTERQVKWRAEL
jgi:hypothetical protein